MKKIDIKEIIKKSLQEAHKQHGLIKEEAKDQTPNSTEDKYKTAEFRMPKLALEAKTWGSGESTEEGEKAIESYVSNIRSKSMKGNVVDIKLFLKEFNKALGVVFSSGESKAPKYVPIAEGEQPNLTNIVSALVLRQALVSMIRKNKGGTAGDLWEGFVARLLNKSLPTGEDKPIEDIEGPDEEGYLTSLKLVSPGSDITGSKLNLAIGLGKPNVKGVKYIIGMKDKQEDPFVVSFSSFAVTKENYFQFVLQSNSPSSEEIMQFINAISAGINQLSAKASAKTTTGGLKEAKKDQEQKTPEIEGLSKEVIDAVVSGKYKSKASDDVFFKYIYSEIQDPTLAASAQRFSDALGKLTPQQRAYIVEQISSNETIAKDLRQKISKDQFDLIAKTLKDGNLKAILGSKKVENFTGFFKSPVMTMLDMVLSTYDETTDKQSRKSLADVINALDEINSVFSQKKAEVIKKVAAAYGASYKAGTADIQQKIDGFWQQMSGVDQKQITQLSNISKSGAFKYSGFDVFKQAFLEVDHDYTPIYVSVNELFISTQSTAELFNKYAEPIYKDHYEMDQFIRMYFVEDKPEGMASLDKKLDDTKVHIDQFKEGAGYKKASELKEDKKPLKHSSVDDILDEHFSNWRKRESL
jgi:hypothetical protein